jgi:CAAX prenyl protease-like protein
VSSLGAIALAAEFSRRWLGRRGVRVLDVYAAVLGLPCVWGFALFGLDRVIGGDRVVWALGVPVGFAAGIGASWCDRRILRFANRHAMHQERPATTARRVLAPPTTSLQRRPFGGALTRERRALRGGSQSSPPSALYMRREIRPVTVAAVAIVEELVYRGALTQACLLLPERWLAALALTAVTLSFALTHVWFGWSQVLAKVPLSALALGSTLALGSVVPAITAHTLFNLKVWRDLRDQPVDG